MYLQVIWDQDVTSIYPKPLTGKLNITCPPSVIAHIWSLSLPFCETIHPFSLLLLWHLIPKYLGLVRKPPTFSHKHIVGHLWTNVSPFPLTGSQGLHSLASSWTIYPIPAVPALLTIRRLGVFVCCCSWRKSVNLLSNLLFAANIGCADHLTHWRKQNTFKHKELLKPLKRDEQQSPQW